MGRHRTGQPGKRDREREPALLDVPQDDDEQFSKDQELANVEH